MSSRQNLSRTGYTSIPNLKNWMKDLKDRAGEEPEKLQTQTSFWI